MVAFSLVVVACLAACRAVITGRLHEKKKIGFILKIIWAALEGTMRQKTGKGLEA
jgi:type IV secretory pathway VirB2 component (pilin)